MAIHLIDLISGIGWGRFKGVNYLNLEDHSSVEVALLAI
jgi:hypothetical protein